MEHIEEQRFGRFVECVDKTSGELYTDWRSTFYGSAGLVSIGTSKKNPGQKFIYFYPRVFGDEQPYFHTPVGNFAETETEITLTLIDSIWKFELGDFDLSEFDKLSFYFDKQTWQLNP